MASLRERLIESWLKPPWEWGWRGALGFFIFSAAIVLVIERDRIVSIQIGTSDGVNIAMAFHPEEPVVVPEPGEQLEISAFISGVQPGGEPSTCSLTVDIPEEEEPLRTGPEAVAEDGKVEWSIPAEEFTTVGEVPVTVDLIADCDVAGEEFSVLTELDLVSE